VKNEWKLIVHERRLGIEYFEVVLIFLNKEKDIDFKKKIYNYT